MNRSRLLFLIRVLTFLSGGAALIYEIVWFRSLSLIFGGAQLAVTTTVVVFMTGLALGNWMAARHLYRFGNLLFLYGILETGIAASAGIFRVLVGVYPKIYIHLAGIAPDSSLYLACIRIAFASTAMIIPAALMGAALPVLAAHISKNPDSAARNVSFLYGYNTLGAVAGATAAGFLLLRIFPVGKVMLIAAGINILTGLTSFVLSRKGDVFVIGSDVENENNIHSSFFQELFSAASQSEVNNYNESTAFMSKLVLWGTCISGFCALGYEVLWTRILVLFLGATVYSFTVILAAFLLGIGLGGSSYSVFRKIISQLRAGSAGGTAPAAISFGIIQISIGIVTVWIMSFLFDLPAYSVVIRHYLFMMSGDAFSSRQIGNFIVAFAFMTVPAFLMGLSIPLAAKVHANRMKTTAGAVGELFAYNTVGAILGAAIVGYFMVSAAGIERSLQVLCLFNIGSGMIILAGARKRKRLMAVTAFTVASLMAFLLLNEDAFRLWDRKYLATYTPDRAVLYSDKAGARRQLENNEVLYYAEGAEAIVSSTFRKDTGTIQFTVNGRPEASTNLEDVQNQYMLGHLPMLLHRNPKKALVIGAGSGMTLSAVASHPGLEDLKLVEIEPKVLGVARAFGEYNHNIVDNPELDIIYNDARNYLLTSRDKFDVITSDPIHPIWRGSGYLYTSEFFRLATKHLSPGGIMCQWLPLYLLSKENVRSIVRTFRQNFRYIMVWITLADVQLIGSDQPVLIDIHDLERRIREPAVFEDLKNVFMGSAEELLTYFLMGDKGAAAFSNGAVMNKDNNVYLEFSSPATIDVNAVEAHNLREMISYREDIDLYLESHNSEDSQFRANMVDLPNETIDRAHVAYLSPDKHPDKLHEIREDLKDLPSIGRVKSISVGLFGYE